MTFPSRFRNSPMYPAQEHRHRGSQPVRPSLVSRALRLEWLESRLALSHGPLSHDGDAFAACGPQAFDFASPGFQAESVGFHQFDNHARDFGPRSGPDFDGGPEVGRGRVDVDSNDCPAPIAVQLPPMPVFDPAPPVVITVIVISSHVAVAPPVRVEASVHGKADGPSFAPSAALRLSTPADVVPVLAAAAQPASEPHPAAANAVPQPGAALPTIVPAIPVPGVEAVAAHRPGMLAAPDELPTAPQSNGTGPAPGNQGQSSGPLVSGDSSRLAQNDGRAMSAEDTTSKAENVASDSPRPALLASISLNVGAIDDAVGLVVSEVEELGGELVTWLDDLTLPDWGFMAAAIAVLGLGGRFVLRERNRRAAEEQSDAASSSWLFTRLQTP